MKKNIGSVLALYPMPVTVVGTVANGKPNWLQVAHVGIIGHSNILLSVAQQHYSTQYIKDNGLVSVNIVDEALLPKADYVGCVSGAEEDKSDVFGYQIGEKGAPVIEAAPLVMECRVESVFETDGFSNFILSIQNTYAENSVLDNNGRLSYEKLKPVLFEMPTYQYLATGKVLGNCRHINEEAK